MEERRQLKEEERKIVSSMLTKLKERYEYVLYLCDHANLMLKTGLYQNYRQKVLEFEQNLREFSKEREDLLQNITTLSDQLNKGVVIKGGENGTDLTATGQTKES